MYAAWGGETEIVRLLIDAGADPNIADEFGNTALIFAATTSNDEAISLLLDAGAEPDVENNFGFRVLNAVSVGGNASTARILIDAGANPMTPCQFRYTPLTGAVSNGNLEIIRTLLEAGAHPDVQDNYQGNTALCMASSYGQINIIRELLAHGADPNAPSKSRFTPVYEASQCRHPEAVSILIEAGADIEFRDAYLQNTPLIVAVRSGNADTVRVLLQAGADTSVVNEENQTAMDIAESSQNQEIIELLRNPDQATWESSITDSESVESPEPPIFAAVKEHDIERLVSLLASVTDPEFVNDDGTPILIAAVNSGDVRIVRRILEAGADPDFEGSYRENALFEAIRMSNLPVLHELLQAGADYETQNIDSMAPLDLAAINWMAPGTAHIVRALVDAGADPDIVNELDYYPVLNAVIGGNIEALKILLEMGAKSDGPNGPSELTDPYGVSGSNTPLEFALSEGPPEAIKLLLDAGADPNIRMAGGNTPLIWTMKMHIDTEIFYLLLESGADPNMADLDGRTPLDFIMIYGGEEALSALIDAGARN
jgi:ankyrin repeat protein